MIKYKAAIEDKKGKLSVPDKEFTKLLNVFLFCF